VTPPPPLISPPPPAPSAAAKPKRVERRKPAAGGAAKRKPARTAPRERTIPKEFLDQSPPPPVGLPSSAGPAVVEGGDLGDSALLRVLIVAATALALLTLALAALPLGTLERLLAAEAHWRAEQVAAFVDGHRLDITVAGIATLLVVVVVALPTVAG
jgi:hypothetical protein